MFPLGSLFFGFVQQGREHEDASTLDDDAIRQERELREAEHKAKLAKVKGKGLANRVRGLAKAAKAGVSELGNDETEEDAADPFLTLPDEEEDEPATNDEDAAAAPSSKRLSPEEMDALKARMVQEGYPLTDGTPQGNETVWRSLVRGVRRPQVLRLVGMSPDALDVRIAEIRQQRAKQGKR